MSFEPDFHKNDIGAAIVLHVRENHPVNGLQDFNLSGATQIDIKIKKPDGTVQTYTSVAFAGAAEGGAGDGTDGKIKAVTTQASDLPDPGDYEAKAYIELPGWSGHSGTAHFPVGDIF